MPKFVSIHANGNKGPVVTVTEAFAESIGATVLDKEQAVDQRTGRPLPPREAGEHVDEKKAPAKKSAAKKTAAKKTAAKSTTNTGGRAASSTEETK